MIGRVRSYIPAMRGGIVQTETGDEFRFYLERDDPDLQGGDIVEFELGGDGQLMAVNVSLRHRWVQMLNEKHRRLVDQFHKTVMIHT